MEQLLYLTTKMQIVILCGGKATRLSGILDTTPKILAKINDVPFIDYIFDYLFQFETIKKITLLTGIGSELISSHVDDRYSNSSKVVEIQKDDLLGQGTSQALSQALNHNVLDKDFLLMFGDSLPDLDLNDFISKCFQSKSNIFFSYIDEKHVDEECRIEEIDGKIRYHSDLETRVFTSSSNFFIDYGVYYINMNKELESLLQKEDDLKNVLDKFSRLNDCLGSESVSPFIEIGNPISFTSAHDKIRKRY
jgi:D-glycero-alpha-D-manno-heptose 1-phosphate guanylyltransferase